MRKFENLKYKNQNLDDGTIKVYDKEDVIICEMFIDEDGDIGFYYKGEEVYLRQIKFCG